MHQEKSTANRRALLMVGAAVLAGSAVGSVAGCGTTSTTPSLTQPVIDAIQKGVAKICSFVPDVRTLIALISKFPGLNGLGDVANNPLLTEVISFLCGEFHAGGGTEAVVNGKPPKLRMKEGAEPTVPCHGLVWDPKTGKFVEF